MSKKAESVGCSGDIPCNFRKGLAQAGGFLIVMLVIAGGLSMLAQYQFWQLYQPSQVTFERFDTCSGIIDAFNDSRQAYRGWGVLEDMAVPTAAGNQADTGTKASDYSETNIQVEGVDEADIVKTDGEYIYTISGRKLVIIRAWPSDDAEVLSEISLGDFSPEEMFVKGDVLMLFGSTTVRDERPETLEKDGVQTEIWYPYYRTLTTVQLWDVSDRGDPDKERELDFEGNYLASRMIDDDVYFVINSYPRVYAKPLEEGDIVPLYRDSIEGEELVPTCGCAEVGYFDPGYAESFLTLASMSISDTDADVRKEVIVGSGQNIYASQDNIYIADYNWGWFPAPRPLIDSDDVVPEQPQESTIVHKFSLDDGSIEYEANAEVPGRVLNQFSMDEFGGHFRIATTLGRLTRSGGTTSNNIYIYDDSMELVGSLEDIAPGESIYSARFMGERGYLVTFKKVDPFFVLDLSDPEEPEILGKLKIPGYSDYLHPYDEDHIIGIGKETIPAGEEEWGDFTWYQGVKIALFDVTDVENPIELHKIEIGDRGTDSYALHDHKAFLFDRERELLVIPILLAEIKGDPSELPDWSYGDYVFQGAYVYNLNLDEGFDLLGRITHFDDDDAFEKSGYYFYDGTYSVKRSGYLDDVLWTLSNNRLKLNQLSDLEELASLDFGDPDEPKYWIMEASA